MVCVGRKAQVLARRGMCLLRAGNHPSRRRAFRPVNSTRVANISPSPGQRSVYRTGLIPTAVLHVMQAVSQRSSGSRNISPEQFLRLTSTAEWNPGWWSADKRTLPAHLPGTRLCRPSPSPPSPPASPREIPTHPGCSRPVRHRSRCAVSRSRPLFFQVLLGCGSPDSSPENPSVNAASTVG